jgi:hypothetical protein
MSVVAGFHLQNIDVDTEITYFVHVYTVRGTSLKVDGNEKRAGSGRT